ncbi:MULTISPECIES: F0F1 ATP synthase subunit gamma [unclassified Streptomyces]|uniref:F0F1 ATP synthase subunit gamma n=1 Tax=unclassified Streptomyces TaxID=2593676 RepID=UPI002DD89D26|nr:MULTISPECIES: F0F1 ATP synthase subunit gamma [unclassified Streptomyces]WSA92323.1 F0F1 ATP synthase subunit gamma [Streptomyces sp. NBC_01795]WSB76692.1 F0F1 ATP synthase subunit gamma [Streptomyces sp. NBC_01775]WSS15021.1 F0F1 ATP synthase subunit gamma [Streptomyces sp. NBC_01186]WSS43865.1 F0F1 ATP synthase subunit gamma [Streptomyces sp. NBC_01187]
MGAQLRVYKRRIKSVTATKKITRAMEMIAASRIVKAQRRVAASEPYATELTRAVTAVAQGSDTKHPLTTEAERPTRAAVLLITSDRGLAGGYNSNAIKAAERLNKRLTDEGKEIVSFIVGSKGVSYYGFRGRPVEKSWSGFTDNPTYGDAKAVAAPLIDAITAETGEGGVDELHIVYTEFISMITQTPVDNRMLPLSFGKDAQEADVETAKSGSAIMPLYDFEPSAEDVLDALLPRYVESRIYNALLQAAASKHAATRRAMKSATDNAEDLIKSLTRLANAARQADITQEISEIVGGASALADANAGSDR